MTVTPRDLLDVQPKDPNDKLDFLFDWRANTNANKTPTPANDFLESGETISSATLYVDGTEITSEPQTVSGLTVGDTGTTVEDTNSSVRIWLTAGTVNVDYTLTCQVVTSSSRTIERSIRVEVRDR